MENKRGPDTEPCATPLVRGSNVDFPVNCVTLCDRSVRYKNNNVHTVLSVPNMFIFSISFWWSTLSNASKKSKSTSRPNWPVSKPSLISSLGFT